MEKQTHPNRPALGKGLASLLPQVEKPVPQAAAPAAGHAEEKAPRIPGITVVDIDTIETNVFQPRRDFDETALQELAESIRAKGIIQPLVVRRGVDGKIHLIAGERRLRASKIAGLKQVPVVIRQSSDKETLEIALIENIQRENLNCIEIALSYYQLMEDFQLTQEDVAKRVGKDRASVANHVRLLKLPEEIIRDLRENKLSFGHGKALLALKDALQRMEVRGKILEKNLSVRDTEALVTQMLADPVATTAEMAEEKSEGDHEEAIRHLSQRLGRTYGAKVAVKGNGHRGSIVIKYFSRENLDQLVEQLLR